MVGIPDCPKCGWSCYTSAVRSKKNKRFYHEECLPPDDAEEIKPVTFSERSIKEHKKKKAKKRKRNPKRAANIYDIEGTLSMIGFGWSGAQ